MRRIVFAAWLLVFACVSAASAAPRRADLQVSSLRPQSRLLAPGERLAATAAVRNRGRVRAKRSRVGFYLSIDAKRSRDDVRVSRVRTKALRPGKRANVKASIALPAALRGTFRLIACADDAKKVRERSERNNCRASAAVTVRAPVVTPTPTPTPTATATATPGAPQPPVNSVPASAFVPADSSGPIAGVSVADPDSPTLTVTLTGTNGVPTPATVSGTVAAVNDALGELTFAPAPGFTGTASLQVLTSDGVLSDTDAIPVTVQPNVPPEIAVAATNLGYTENDPATPVDPALTVTDGNESLAGATVQITSGHAPGQDVLELAFPPVGISASFDAASGKLTLTGNATPAAYQTALRAVTYRNTSDSPSSALRTITLTVTDGFATATGSRNVSITPVNDPPVAAADASTTDEDTVLTRGAPGVLDNDADPDAGDTKTVTMLNGSGTLNGTSAKGGAVTIAANGGYTYTPAATFQSLATGQSDTDSFTYTMRDAAGVESTATVTITIAGVSDAPDAGNDSFNAVGNTQLFAGTTRPAGTPGRVITGSVLANDSDPDTAAASLTAVPLNAAATTLGGAVTVESDGNFTYTPPAGTTATSDTFDYTVTDGVATDTGTVSIALGNRVWYVRNTQAAGGLGRSSDPFDTLAEAQTASAAGDTIYVFRGDGTSNGMAAGIVLKAGQRLLGQASDLIVNGDTLLAGTAGQRPLIADTNADVIDLAGNVTIANVIVDPAGTGGALFGSGTTGVSLFDVALTDAGTPASQAMVELVNGGIAFGGTITITSPQAKALDVTGSALSGTIASTSVTGATDGGVSLVNTTGSLIFNDLTLTTASGAAAAMRLSNADNIDVMGAAFNATITASGGPALDATQMDAATELVFDTVSSTGSTTKGINLDGTGAWTFSAPAGTIAGAAGGAFDLNGGSGLVSYAGNLANHTSGETVEVTGRSGSTILSGNITGPGGTGITVSGNSAGTTTFSGTTKTLNTATNTAVNLTTNSGHTITFTNGGLDIDTTSGTGLNASGGGTVSVTGSGNTIDSTSATALSVTSTTIGASDLTFQRISSGNSTAAADPASGIVLNNTGTSGGVIAAGTGTADSGGVIQNTTGPGIDISSANDLSLTRFRIQGSAGHGINGINLRGTNVLQSSTIAGWTAANSNGIYFENTNANGTLTVTGSTISGAPALGTNDGILAEARGTSSMSLTVNGASVFSDLFGDGIQVNTITGASGTFTVDVQNSTFQNAQPRDAPDDLAGGGNGGITLTPFGGPATMNATINNNTFTNIRKAANVLGAIQVTNGDLDGGGPTLNLSITNNTIHNGDRGRGIGIVADTFAGPTDITISGNSIDQVPQHGIAVGARNGAVVDVTISGNTIGRKAGFVGKVATSSGSSAINVDAQNEATMRALITANLVSSDSNVEVVRGRAIGTSTMNTTYTNNNIVDTTPGAGQQEIETTANLAGSNPTVCALFTGNTLTSGAGFISLERTVGTVRTPQASAAAIASANGIPAGNVTVSAGVAFNGAACALPN